MPSPWVPEDARVIRVLFVCMGNICRSPTAEAVFRRRIAEAGLHREVEADSAGTHGDYHAGEPPDARAAAAAARRGYDLSGLAARRAEAADFERFDYVLAMDRDNLAALRRTAPLPLAHKARLFMEFSTGFAEREVPDPYYGGTSGFENVLDMIEDGVQGFISHLLRVDLNRAASRAAR